MGNLTRDPEITYTPKGSAICNFGIAINRTWKDDNEQKQEETTFVDVTYFGKTGEVIGKYVKKGQPLYVEGRLKMDEWQDKTTGQNRSKMKVIGESFQFLSSGKTDGGSGTAENNQPAQAQSGVDADGDDIPFAQFEENSPLPL
jgi:single-strand DNA-binding protein